MGRPTYPDVPSSEYLDDSFHPQDDNSPYPLADTPVGTPTLRERNEGPKGTPDSSNSPKPRTSRSGMLDCCKTQCGLGRQSSLGDTIIVNPEEPPTPDRLNKKKHKFQAYSHDGYVSLADDSDSDDGVAKFVRTVSELKVSVRGLRYWIEVLLLVVGLLVTALVGLGYDSLAPDAQSQTRKVALLASIPLVALLFTWFHIWLAIQMMFLPVKFTGIWQYGDTGTGIGWQGVVPRKAHKMAKTAYQCARPYLDGPRDWLKRVNPRSLVKKIKPHLTKVIEDALNKVGSRHVSTGLPEKARKRMADAAIEKIEESSPEIWDEIVDLLCDERLGIDNDGMIVKVFTESKETLNQFFLKLGDREFRFIEHCGAAMGFFCGLIQLIAFNNLGPVGRAIFLPTTGFFLGIVTNWLAIVVVFKPCFPRPVYFCGWHLFDIQGLFLKRQSDVAVLYSKMLCEHFLAFNKVVDYLQTLPELWGKLKDSYVAFNTRVMRQTLGFTASLLPLALGQAKYEAFEEELKVALVDGLNRAQDLQKIGGKYIGKVTEIEQNNCAALQKMPPDEFENLLHPIFKEDEWILILLGGLLGAMVGLAQVYFLSE